MTDEEVQKFLDLIDSEGISSVFDPGVSVMPDDGHTPDLLVLPREERFAGALCVHR